MPYYGRKRKSYRTSRATGGARVTRRPRGRKLPGRPIRRIPNMSRRMSTRKSVGYNRKALRSVATAVKRLQLQRYGNIQLARQICLHNTDPVHPAGTNFFYSLCAEQPLGFMLQDPTVNCPIWQCELSPIAPFTFTVQERGRFVAQPFKPVALAGPGDAQYNSQLFWNNTAPPGGVAVENKFLMLNSSYDINLRCLGLSGLVQLCLVTYKRNTLLKDSNIRMQWPYFLESMVDTCPLTLGQNVLNQRFHSVKVIKSHYFCNFGVTGVDPDAPSELHSKPQVHQTYPEHAWHVRIKGNSVIEVSDRNDGEYNYTQLPMSKQSFLVIRTSIPQNNLTAAPTPILPGSNPYQRLQVQIMRTVAWRDMYGQSV